MDFASLWRQFFASWPESIPQRGVLVTSYGEQIAFAKFLLSEHFLMIERVAPDTVGARRLLVPYAKIETVKLTDPIRDEAFLAAGYLPGGNPAAKRKTPAPV